MTDEMKRCDFCGEIILAIAKKCKHCGSILDKELAAMNKTPQRNADYGVFLIAIPLISTMLIWFWVSGMNLRLFHHVHHCPN
jgi:hypothetical protein